MLVLMPMLVAGLPLGLLAGCGRPEPGAPITTATSPPAPSPASASASAPAPSPILAEAAASAPNAPASQPSAPLPPAVVAFQKQRDACDHFRGEEPYSKQRAAFLKAQLAKTCKGSDRALAALRQRFAKHPEALAALRDYEDRIE